MSRTTTTTETLPPLSPIKDIPAYTQRGGNLSISTSTPRPTEEVSNIQSPLSGAQPQHPSPHRTFSGPAAIPSSSIQSTLASSLSPVSPSSAEPGGARKKNLRFEKVENELRTTKTTPAFGNPKRAEMVSRRHSADPRLNVHTECGRHGDDWLFGGWNVTDTVKKIWERKETK